MEGIPTLRGGIHFKRSSTVFSIIISIFLMRKFFIILSIFLMRKYFNVFVELIYSSPAMSIATRKKILESQDHISDFFCSAMYEIYRLTDRKIITTPNLRWSKKWSRRVNCLLLSYDTILLKVFLKQNSTIFIRISG